MSKVRSALLVAAIVGGALAPFARSPHPEHAALDVRQLAAAVSQERDHVSAMELAEWIHARKEGLRVIDLRDEAAFEEKHIPRAERMTLESLVSSRFGPGETIVLYSGGGAHAAQAWVFLRALGVERVYFLRGGFEEWRAEVLAPVLAPDLAPAESARRAALSRYFGGVPRRGEKASPPPNDEVKPAAAQRWSLGC